jgi:hypothetical protein
LLQPWIFSLLVAMLDAPFLDQPSPAGADAGEEAARWCAGFAQTAAVVEWWGS